MTTTELKESTATQKSQFELIKGEFDPNDALEIIIHMIKQKINFHNNRNFSQILRYGNGDEWSLTRIEELKESREMIATLLEQADKEGKKLSIKSNISIELI